MLLGVIDERTAPASTEGIVLEDLDEQFVDLPNGHRICFDTVGDPANPPMLLVMGLGAQLIHWDIRLCRALATQGFFVIRFDNRDIGRSRHLHDGPAPKLIPIALGFRRSAAYRLTDFANDAVALLDHLGIERAHVVGASLGGAITQTIAIEQPDRVATATSIMGPSGAIFAELPRLRLLPQMLRATPEDDPVASLVAFNRTIGSPGYPFDEDLDRERVTAARGRAFDPAGVQRQLGALLASGSRRRKLRSVTVPMLVIHGEDDPLVPVRAGRAVARAVPDATLEVIPGMGHDAPAGLWPRLVRLVTEHAAQRSTSSSSATMTSAR